MGESTLAALVGALFGAVIGSFLNVCIVRLPADQSVVSPPSRCPRCGKPVEWRDNIPVLSWVLLGGKCRGCREPISVLYPLVELATAVLWGVMAWRYGLSVDALKGALFGTLLLGIALTDAREYIIPNEFTYGGLAIGLILSAAGGLSAVLAALVGAAVGFAILWVVGVAGRWAFKEEAMGGGDIKMMAMVGSFVGWQGVLLTIFLGALAGTAIFLPLTLIGKKKLVPFGVFLAIGAAVTFVVGPAIIDWYRRYLGVA
ncbi:MAG TPA: prepilin peptidase [Gemmatimonadales bacterium]|nr:prepilin peptidase [Gemmatimonadales bacterium]